ncbi:hypothetical protein K469DRAFT_94795 [Zopfia rhizophila CBS 207.26]|uniref:Uncharacterized protein n=1 Tax=Zopfia rhizophila CBS 207.26 TaxID=1314779 RepID=A0A6A6EC36_9PEZI|nr:hypothetical protein K469DRAFT_94795 [Zopfia rhizophila CBS 207.26]
MLNPARGAPGHIVKAKTALSVLHLFLISLTFTSRMKLSCLLQRDSTTLSLPQQPALSPQNLAHRPTLNKLSLSLSSLVHPSSTHHHNNHNPDRRRKRHVRLSHSHSRGVHQP